MMNNCLKANSLLNYEDHFIMLLWERHVLQKGLSREDVFIELEFLANSLKSLRECSFTPYLTFTESTLKSNLELALCGSLEKKHLVTIKKIENLIPM